MKIRFRIACEAEGFYPATELSIPRCKLGKKLPALGTVEETWADEVERRKSIEYRLGFRLDCAIGSEIGQVEIPP